MSEDLRDDQWKVIAPLLPAPKRLGRPRADDRTTLNGILLGPSGQALAGRTCMNDTGALLPATAACRSGKSRQCGSTYGSESCALWTSRASWTGATLFWMVASYQPKRGEDVDYGWKGKGSTVHMMTEGQGVPLAFDVTAASVSEVTVGLDVVDRVRVPRSRGRPRKRPAALAADKSYDSAAFRRELRRRGIQPLVPQRQWPGRKRRPARPRKCTRSARVAGRWSVLMAGWTTGAGWSFGTIDIPTSASPF